MHIVEVCFDTLAIIYSQKSEYSYNSIKNSIKTIIKLGVYKSKIKCYYHTCLTDKGVLILKN